MSAPPDGTVTQMLNRLHAGEQEALDDLVPMIYTELRQMARWQIRKQHRDLTLGATDLVNEVYLKLVRNNNLRAEDRVQFFAIAAKTMRSVLIDYARAKTRQKRGGGAAHIPLDEASSMLTEREAEDVLALDEALTRLQQRDERASRIVQYRFFTGLTIAETAQVMELSPKTVQRSWTVARAWLRKEVGTF